MTFNSKDIAYEKATKLMNDLREELNFQNHLDEGVPLNSQESTEFIFSPVDTDNNYGDFGHLTKHIKNIFDDDNLYFYEEVTQREQMKILEHVRLIIILR
jgi:hypothetical protein